MKTLLHRIYQFFRSNLARHAAVNRSLGQAENLVELEQLQKRSAQKE